MRKCENKPIKVNKFKDFLRSEAILRPHIGAAHVEAGNNPVLSSHSVSRGYVGCELWKQTH